MNILSAAQAAGESTEQKIARLERKLAAAQEALRIGNNSADDQMFQKREAQAQRDKAISHLVNILHAADELADCVGIIKWDKEIDMARIFLKECGK